MLTTLEMPLPTPSDLQLKELVMIPSALLASISALWTTTPPI